MLKDANSKAVIEAVKKRVAEISPSLPSAFPSIHSSNGGIDWQNNDDHCRKPYSGLPDRHICGGIVTGQLPIRIGSSHGHTHVSVVCFVAHAHFWSGCQPDEPGRHWLRYHHRRSGYHCGVHRIQGYCRADETGEFTSWRETTLPGQHCTSRRQQNDAPAVFGQLIIIIVFIPILSLVGVEGKMFRFMALVFSLHSWRHGFMFLPTSRFLASMFIKPSDPWKRSISTCLIRFLENMYTEHFLGASPQQKAGVEHVAVLLLLFTGFYLHKDGMNCAYTWWGRFCDSTGTENRFVPQQTAETRIEKILKKKNFPK